MRISAIIPALCCAAALILSFLCLFAGHKPGFMEDYSLLTLNSSQLGQTLLNDSRSSSNPILNLFNSIPNEIASDINSAIGKVTAEIGIQDWYSAHMLDFCEGQYVPGEVANATLSLSQIHKNVTSCSKAQAMYKFDPTAIVQEALNNATKGKVTLEDINWPQDIEDGIKALNALMAAMFVLYCIAIAFIGIAFLAAVVGIISSGRLSACVNFLIAILAFLAIGLASALSTAVVVKAAHLINKYGNKIGLAAYWGGKFLTLTWVATGLMLVVVALWVVEFCIGRRGSRRTVKHG